MLTNTRKVRIEWGDCDPAGIVFYPRYFEMFETCIATLFERATGMTKYQMLRQYDFPGDKLAVEGFETRVWVARDPVDPARIKAQAIPPEVVERFTRVD
jgi:4-hydroxybenzoyl-CoA thioesterase